MRLKSCLVLALAFLLGACGGGGGGGNINPTPALAAPTQLTVTDSGLNQITLRWVAPATPFDGYYLEGRLGTDAFQRVFADLIPSTYDGLLLTFMANAPDNMTYSFRLQAAKGTTLSPYSNEAAYNRGPNAPGQATASFNWSTGAVTLAWDRNTATSDGLLVERAACDQFGTAGTWSALVAPDPLASTFVDTGVAKNLYYTYRITNRKGTLSGQPSAPSYPVFTGLAAPAWVSAYYDSTAGGVQVTWGPTVSGGADGILLERSDCDGNGTSLGNWAALAVPAGFRTAFLDLTVVEGRRHTYRVSYLYGTSASQPYLLSYNVSIPLLPPINLQVVALPAGLQLTWQNRSLAANQIVVRRNPAPGNSSDIAILSPGIATYLDPVTNLGYYTYTVVAKNGAGEAASSAVSAGTLNPADALALTATALNLPFAADAALRPSGAWAFATSSPFGILSNGDPWAATFPSNASRGGDPIVQVDGQGWPHAIYATSPAGSVGASTLIHLWYDGTTWKSESMATATIPYTSANQGWTYRLDATGTPHVLLDHVTASQPYGGATASLSYVHKVNGAWTEEPLDGLTPAIGNVGTFHISLDGADTPHVLLGNWMSVVDFVRTGPGAWTATTVPAGSLYAGWYDFLDALWIDADNGWVFYENYVNVGTGVNVVQKKGGVWLPPQLLDTQATNGSTAAHCALSPDRTRVALLYSTGAGIKVSHQTALGWHQTLVAPSSASYAYVMRIGFDGSQKAHILLSAGSGYLDLHE